MRPQTDVVEEVKAKLRYLHDNPADTQAASDNLLRLIYTFLIQDDTPNEQPSHWFCLKADALVIEAATFLLRLHAYNSSLVDRWRTHLRRCLFGCVSCIQKLQEVKTISRHTYFGAFGDDVIRNFYLSFSNWELQSILDGLAREGIRPGASSSERTARRIPSSFLYHICANPHIFRDSNIHDILESFTPSEVCSDWPADIPPPGLLLLTMSRKTELAQWAMQQLYAFKTTPIPSERLLPMYTEVLQSASAIMSSTSSSNIARAAEPPPLPVTNNESALWASYSTILRYIPPEWLRSNDASRTRKVVIGHLSDVGNHFVHVLRSFALLLTRIGPTLFKDEGGNYSAVVFNVIKDNPRFEDLIASQGDAWSLEWMQPFVKAAGELPGFTDVFPIVIQCLCEQLQHARFKDARPRAIDVACKTLMAILHPEAKGKASSPETAAAYACLDIHASMLVTVGFGKSHLGESWETARAGARRLIRRALGTDTKNVAKAITTLARAPPNATVPEIPTIREQMWTLLYQTVQPDDVEGIATILSILSQIAHMDKQTSSAYDNAFEQFQDPRAARKVFDWVNRIISVFCSGFSDAAARFELESTNTMLNLFNTRDVPQHLAMLMFSPMDGLREPARNIVGLALEVDSRQDCFRAFLKKYTQSTMIGIRQFLEIFAGYARNVPEACHVSKSLALCLTDIIEVMCSPIDGLLLDPNFLESLSVSDGSNILLTWWHYMTKALTVIFHKTPRWAAYFNNADMVLWMRDALIFGRDMLDKRNIIEIAASGHTPGELPANGKRSSKIATKMAEDLQPVLMELTRWLRLTDEELLHQSFALLDTLLSCFLKIGTVKPSDEALRRLRKFVADARDGDSKARVTMLDANRAKNLHEKLLQFDEDDEVEIISHKLNDEVQIVGHKLPTPSTLVKPTKKAEAFGTVKYGPSRPSVVSKLRESSTVKTVAEPKRRPASIAKPFKSEFFSAGDKRRLDASSSAMPTFRSSIKATAPSAYSQNARAREHPSAKESEASSAASMASVSSSSDEEEEENLATLAQMQRTPKIKRTAERRQVKMIDMPTNARHAAFDRLTRKEDPRERAARTRPDVSSLHRRVLSWDYNHDGPEPPGQKLSLLHVPDRFSDVEHYRRVFEPLLLMECWAQIQQSKDFSQDSFECRIMSRQYSDQWADLEISFEEGVRRDWQLTETDIVLLKHPDHKKGYLAKTQHFRAQPNQSLQATIRMTFSPQEPGPQINSRWTLSKVFSLTTVHREYAALVALRYYGLRDTILHPELRMPTLTSPQEVRHTMVDYCLNEPQAKAILSAMKTEGFSLIQGPPGTGKTSTICGLVQMFLARRPKPVTTINVPGRNAGPPEKEPPQKILICAPSNAAIDEITFRLKQGITGAGRKAIIPKVVRVGAPQAMSNSVLDVALDTLVRAKIDASPEAKKQNSNATMDKKALFAELDAIKQKRATILADIQNIPQTDQRYSLLKDELERVTKQRADRASQLDRLKDQEKSDFRTMDALSRKYRAEILREADVICTTLSGAGHEQLEPFDFEMVVIDEAAQAIELSSLIPLKYRFSRCVMVGDPQQLPPTVISQEASRFAYNQSLFVRLQKQRPDAVHLLSIQYRMHPVISQLPSRIFYQGRLVDGPDMDVKTGKPWHSHPKFGVYRFYNVHRGQEETTTRHSYKNSYECQVAIALYNRLTREFPHDYDSKVGVVSMYKAQVDALRAAFVARFGESIKRLVDFNTVDGFQGQEKEIIILSCVRAGPGVQSVGFLSDVRRMNVAITRARSSLFVLGHAATLERSDDTWHSLIADARERSCFVDVDVVYFTSAGTSAVPRPLQPAKASVRLPLNVSMPEMIPVKQTKTASVTDVEMTDVTPTQPPTIVPSPTLPKRSVRPQKRPAPDDGDASTPGPSEGERKRPKVLPKIRKAKPQDCLFIKKR